MNPSRGKFIIKRAHSGGKPIKCGRCHERSEGRGDKQKTLFNAFER